jgi:hypothetical protein
MNRSKKIEIIGAKVALYNGLVFGFGFLFIVSFLGLLFADGLLGIIGIGALLSYNHLFVSFILLYLTFPYALWIFGKNNSLNLIKEKSIIKISAGFSFGVNLFIWTVFLVSQLAFGGFEYPLYLSLTIMGIVLTLGVLTTCSLGLYIVRLTKEKIKVIHNT